MNSNIQKFHSEVSKLLQADQIFYNNSDTWPYGYDNSKIIGKADMVVFPQDHDDVVNIIQLCNKYLIPVTARGKGTGTTGAAVPIQGGVVISTERLNRILEVSINDRYMVVEPGVTNQEVQDEAARHGFFWPPDPTSARFCTIGGNLAYNSAGPRAVKYGTCRENTLGLKVVSGKGETFTTGSHTTKSVVGYDLTRLLIGSEGTLGFITEAILKLTPLPEKIITIQLEFESIEDATLSVARLMSQPLIPYTLEFMDKGAIAVIRDYAAPDLATSTEAILIVELATSNTSSEHDVEQIFSALPEVPVIKTVATDKESIELIWKMRKSLSPALRKIAPKKINEDVVVPVSRIPQLLHEISRLSHEFNIKIVNFGHAGNGNIHVNLLVNHSDANEMQRAEQCLEEIFRIVLKLRGSISGEHGIGIAKYEFIEQEIGKVGRQIMQDIKAVFDPNKLLNSGKSI